MKAAYRAGKRLRDEGYEAPDEEPSWKGHRTRKAARVADLKIVFSEFKKWDVQRIGFLLRARCTSSVNIGHRLGSCLRQRSRATYHFVPPSALQPMSPGTLGDFAQGGNVLGDIAPVMRLASVPNVFENISFPIGNHYVSASVSEFCTGEFCFGIGNPRGWFQPRYRNPSVNS